MCVASKLEWYIAGVLRNRVEGLNEGRQIYTLGQVYTEQVYTEQVYTEQVYAMEQVHIVKQMQTKADFHKLVKLLYLK